MTGVALLLAEMHAPIVASTLRDRGHDVIDVVSDPALREMSDGEVLAYAAANNRRVVTENVKDFRPLLHQAEDDGVAGAAVLFTTSRIFPRSRRNPGPLIDALDAWLRAADVASRPAEDWLTKA